MMSLGHALAGLVLILSFAMLGQQRVRAMLWLCAMQALVVALVVLLQRDLRLVWFALVAFALNGLLMPLLLVRQGDDERITRAGAASWASSLILAAVSVAAAMQVASGGRVELLGAALAVVLLGLLQSARSPTTGVLSAQYGVILLVAALPHVAPLALAAAALPIVPVIVALASRQVPSVSASRLALAITACLMAAGIVLALLSDEPAITWLAFALAMSAATVHDQSDTTGRVPVAAAMLLALMGTLLLHLAADSEPLAWSGAAVAHVRPLNLAGIFLLLGYGAVAAGQTRSGVGAAAVLVTVPLLALWRLRQIGLAPELFLALGLATLLVAAGLRRPIMAVLGLIVFALGVTEASTALLLIASLVLVGAMRQLMHVPFAAAAVRVQRVADFLLAAVPLFALYLVADATAARSLWLLPPLALGAVAASILALR